MFCLSHAQQTHTHTHTPDQPPFGEAAGRTGCPGMGGGQFYTSCRGGRSRRMTDRTGRSYACARGALGKTTSW